MYLNNKPSIHDIVFVQLGTSSDKSIGNYVQMVEYDNLEGLVLCTEITRFKSNLKTLVKRDEIFPVVVINPSLAIRILSTDDELKIILPPAPITENLIFPPVVFPAF